jgi:hypothetical protein
LIPSDPITTLQAPLRAAFGALAARWLADLTEAQRDGWNDYAANTPVPDVLGDSILLSGQQHFVRTNTAALQASLSQINDPPTIYGTGEVPVIGTVTVDTSQCSVALVTMPSQTTAIGYMSRPQNASRDFNRGPYRFFDTVTASPLLDNVPYPTAVGQRVWGYVRYLNDDGRLSQRSVWGPVTVTAPP